MIVRHARLGRGADQALLRSRRRLRSSADDAAGRLPRSQAHGREHDPVRQGGLSADQGSAAHPAAESCERRGGVSGARRYFFPSPPRKRGSMETSGASMDSRFRGNDGFRLAILGQFAPTPNIGLARSITAGGMSSICLIVSTICAAPSGWISRFLVLRLGEQRRIGECCSESRAQSLEPRRRDIGRRHEGAAEIPGAGEQHQQFSEVSGFRVFSFLDSAFPRF